jgi:hypothetical protein
MKKLVKEKEHTDITERLEELTVAWLQHIRAK